MSETTEAQDATAELRERYLYFLTSICEKDAQIKLFDNTSVSGKLRAFDMDFDSVLLEKLETPLQQFKFAKLRTLDIINIETEVISN